MGTVEGGRRAAITNKERFGDDYYKRIGQAGSNTKKNRPSGFAAMPKELVSEIGRKGGTISRRTGVKKGEGKKAKGEHRDG